MNEIASKNMCLKEMPLGCDLTAFKQIYTIDVKINKKEEKCQI